MGISEARDDVSCRQIPDPRGSSMFHKGHKTPYITHPSCSVPRSSYGFAYGKCMGLLLPFLLWSSDSCYLRRNGADKWMFHNAANGNPSICKERETFHKGSAGTPWNVTRRQFSLGSCRPADACRGTHSSRCCCPHRQQEQAARSCS